MDKVLIVDDDVDLLEAMKGILDLRGYEVHCSESAEDAVKKISNNHYDFLLVDYKMPGKDGVWLMENIDLPRDTKALLITAFVNREVIRRMFALGVSGYLIKPFSEDELIKHLSFHAN